MPSDGETRTIETSVVNKITAISSTMTRTHATHATHATTVSSAGNLDDSLGLAIAPAGTSSRSTTATAT
jgi:hypothetical protein